MNKVQSAKLLELRAKTDRQLFEYISNRVESGLSYGRLAADPDARRRWASVDVFQERASKAYSEVHRLLPVVRNLTRPERRTLDAKIQELGRLLGTSPALTRAACF